eukprot:5613711-Pleurochrysis_carterae.AAC.1
MGCALTTAELSPPSSARSASTSSSIMSCRCLSSLTSRSSCGNCGSRGHGQGADAFERSMCAHERAKQARESDNG